MQVFVGHRRLDLLTTPIVDFQAATAVSYTFTKQKNGVNGEVIQHGHSGSDLSCPVLATIRRVLSLRQHRMPAHTPIATYLQANRHQPVTAADITSMLRVACMAVGTPVGIVPSDISARSLRAGGAMALLCACIDDNIIQLCGRWNSNNMLRYLHLQAQPLMRDFAQKTLAGENCTFITGPNVPMY
jgi:hypothetical protein